MPPPRNHKSIKDFFKPFATPKSPSPRNEILEEEIIVAPRPAVPKQHIQATSGAPQDEGSSSPASPKRTLVLRDGSASPKRLRKPRKKSPQADHASASTQTLFSSSARTVEDLPLRDGTSELSTMQPPPIPAAEIKSHDTNTSFSSVSSYSSSKRITKNGLKAVLNSDSGSDESSTSSSDELADISTFVPRKRIKLTPPTQKSEVLPDALSTVKATRRNGRGFRDSVRSNTPPRSPSPPRTVYKHSLANMIKQRQKEVKMDLKIREAEAAFEDATKKREHDVQDQGLDKGLEAAVADDSDQGERMRLALARTEALQQGAEQFHFFRRLRKTYVGKAADCWHEPYTNNVGARHDACISGFLAQTVEIHSLSTELEAWIAHQLTVETRPELCEAYVEILHASAGAGSRIKFDFSDFYDLVDDYDRIEHAPESSISSEDASRPPPPLALDGPPPGLTYILDVIRDRCLVPEQDAQYVTKAVTDLIISALDSSVILDHVLLEKIYDTVLQILEEYRQAGLEQLYSDMLEAFRSRQLTDRLRYNAIASLPASSAKCHRFRRILAANIVAGTRGAQKYSLDLDSPEWNENILRRLKSRPEFAITEAADYRSLASLFSVLDIAIDAGFSDHSFRPSRNYPVKQTGYDAKPALAKAEEATFNAHIDSFTAQLRLMAGRIRDAGTTHLKRTEAKMAIDRLVLRLEYTVRTKPKKRKQIFDGDAEQRSLKGFLKQMEMEGAVDADDESNFATIVPSELLSDRKVRDGSVDSGAADAGGPKIDSI